MQPRCQLRAAPAGVGAARHCSARTAGAAPSRRLALRNPGPSRILTTRPGGRTRPDATQVRLQSTSGLRRARAARRRQAPGRAARRHALADQPARRAERLAARVGGARGARPARRRELQARLARGRCGGGAAARRSRARVRGSGAIAHARRARLRSRARRRPEVFLRRLRGALGRGRRGHRRFSEGRRLGRDHRARLRAEGAAHALREEVGVVHRAAGRRGLPSARARGARALRRAVGAGPEQPQGDARRRREDGLRHAHPRGDPRPGAGADRHQVHPVQLGRLRARRTDDRDRRGPAEPRRLHEARRREGRRLAPRPTPEGVGCASRRA